MRTFLIPSLDLQDRIPGYRGSAAFFTSLQHNLSLDDGESPLPSPLTSPAIHPKTNPVLPLLIPLPTSFSPSKTASRPIECLSPTDSIASSGESFSEKSYGNGVSAGGTRIFLARSYNDKNAALELLRETVREQRLLALTALLAHPLNVPLGMLAVFLAYVWWSQLTALLRSTLALWLAGSTIAALLTAVWCMVTLPYQKLAQSIAWDWLGQDELLIAWKELDTANDFEDEKDTGDTGQVIGVAVLGWRPTEGRLGRKGRRVGRGWIRGWAVQRNFRDQGIGRSLLGEAATIVGSRGGDGIFFCEHHTHSTLVLPSLYAGPFVRRDRRAQASLAHAWEANRCSHSKRRSHGR